MLYVFIENYVREMLAYVYVQGPNYLWHVDGYDKLTPYGLNIHGCIDG